MSSTSNRDKKLFQKLEKPNNHRSSWDKLMERSSFKASLVSRTLKRREYINRRDLQYQAPKNIIHGTYSDKQSNKGEKVGSVEELQGLKSKIGISRIPKNHLIARLSKVYELKEPLNIVRFIIKYPGILPLLFEAPLEIRKYFLDEKLVLKVISDIESSSWQKLVISIFTKESVDEAFNRLNLLDENWWLDATMSNPVGNQLSLGIEFE
jgi:hypothetical protein